MEPGTENAEDSIVWVMLSELRNDFRFPFSETERRHLFLYSGTPRQMLISNMTFTPHLQGDVYLKCNQGKASIHQRTASDKSKTTCWNTDIVKLSGKSLVSNLAKLNCSCSAEKLFQEINSPHRELLVVSGKSSSNILFTPFLPGNSVSLSWKIQVS